MDLVMVAVWSPRYAIIVNILLKTIQRGIDNMGDKLRQKSCQNN